MVAGMSTKLFGRTVLAAGCLGAGIIAITAQVAPSPTAPASTLPAPPTPPAREIQPADAVTQPFRPAVRVPRVLPVNPNPAGTLTNLLFDQEVKEIKAAPDQFDLDFTFAVTNVSAEPVVVSAVRTSCGCTTANLPPMPWTLAAGDHGSFGIKMDLRGKTGSITKSVMIATDKGNKTIYVRGILPDPSTMTEDQRQRNLALARADRQAVFKGECASCHAAPSAGKSGGELYTAACSICHDSTHRNEMVPDLNIAREVRDFEYWKRWIAHGKEGTLMPAFAQEAGGPLNDAQVVSLAHWLTRRYPNPQSFPGNQPELNPRRLPVNQ
ncbi:MAG TPA: hypothetical protein DCY13_17415 [Verrucomicrobiales bacterium]|nr:hypothetical protein [Verrucomicrobiales bacterium]